MDFGDSFFGLVGHGLRNNFWIVVAIWIMTPIQEFFTGYVYA